MFHHFQELVECAKAHPARRIIAVAAAADAPVLKAVLRAKREGVAEPILVGDRDAILSMFNEISESPDGIRIEDARIEDCGLRAVELVASGEANVLMKGMLETRDLLRHVVKKENGLSLGRTMSHVALFEIPTYHKLLACSDGGMLVYPTLSEKTSIVENTASLLRSIGYGDPSIAVLCGIEKVNPKMRETVEAQELACRNARGEILGCHVVGPISYDVAMDASIALHKGFHSPYCGDFDALIVPDLVSGNILGKCLILSCKAKMAGVIVGAKAPIVLSSRGASAEEKFLSIALAALSAVGIQG